MARERDGSSQASQSARSQEQQGMVPLTAALAQLTGSYTDARVANERLAFANANFHLISPATTCGTLQVGCELVLSAVLINPKTDAYDVGGGKVALLKAPLEKIAAAMGLGWVPGLCRRLDDGSDPHYAHFEVAGVYYSFDRTPIPVTGHKEMDIREGSQRFKDIQKRARKWNDSLKHQPNDRYGKKRYPRDPDDQISMERIHVLAHAESKAKLRAIRSVGVHSGYYPHELEKPFVCARMVFTGRTDNPELAKMFGAMIAQSYLNAGAIAYGSQLPAAPSLPLPASNNDNDPRATSVIAHVVEGHKPPKVGQRVRPDEREEDLGEDDDDDDDDDDDREPRDVRDDREQDDEHTPAASPASKREAAARAQSQSRTFTIPAGAERGRTLQEASSGQLQFWTNRMRDDIDNGNSRLPDEDEELFDAMLDEIKARAGAHGKARK